MNLLFVGITLAVIVAGYFAYERQRQIYERYIRAIENDCEIVRNESKVYRNLLFPVLAKAEAAPEGVAHGAATHQPSPLRRTEIAPPMPSGTASVNRKRKRVPFRLFFNQMRKLTNTPQQKTDALAEALAKQKVPQEKQENVSA